MKKLIIIDWDGALAECKSALDAERIALLGVRPTGATKFHRYDTDWQILYSENVSAAEKEKSVCSLKQGVTSSGFTVRQSWGEVIEDRGRQNMFPPLGQQAPIEEMKKWDADFAKRLRIEVQFDTVLPAFSVRLGGTTTVDVTKPGIDQAYGIRRRHDALGIAIQDTILIGDALFPGGNEYSAKEAGIESIQARVRTNQSDRLRRSSLV